MIKKVEICEVLRKLLPEDVTILPNRISNNKVKAISVEDGNLVKSLAYRGENNSNIQSFNLTIRYSENETETEIFCEELYKLLKELRTFTINENSLWVETLKITEPVATGSVRNNIYEQRIEFAIIYTY